MSDWYSVWVDQHCETFAIADQNRVLAMLAWRVPLLDHLGASEVELHETTRMCVLDRPSPNFPNEHLEAIKRHLAELKVKARAREATAAEKYHDRHGTCAKCGDTGSVTVPHPRFIADLEWVPSSHNHQGDPIRATCAVSCDCYRGRKGYDAACLRVQGTDQLPPLTITAYETINPDWRAQMATVEYAAREMTRAVDQAAAMSLPNSLARSFKERAA